MLDYTLIAIAGIAMFAQAILGLLVTTRPPSEKRRIWYEIAFSAIGFVGVSAVIWGGVRTAQVSSRIEYGVAHIEQAGDVSVSLLEKQMDALSAQKKQMSAQGARLDRMEKTIAQGKNEKIIVTMPKTDADTSAPSENEEDKRLDAELARISTSSAKYDALMKCTEKTIPIYVGLIKLSNEAANYQNGWAYSRDGEALRNQYESWVGAVHEFFAEHRKGLPDVSAFDQTKELDMGPTLLILPNSGVNAWQNFDVKRNVLIKISDEVNNHSCTAEQKAYDAFSQNSGDTK